MATKLGDFWRDFSVQRKQREVPSRSVRGQPIYSATIRLEVDHRGATIDVITMGKIVDPGESTTIEVDTPDGSNETTFEFNSLR